MPIALDPEDAVWDHNYTDALYGLFKRLGFQKFIEKWGLTESASGDSVPASDYLPRITADSKESLSALLSAVTDAPLLAVDFAVSLDSLELCDGKAVYTASWNSCAAPAPSPWGSADSVSVSSSMFAPVTASSGT